MKAESIKRIYDIEKILEGTALTEFEKNRILEAVAVREERLIELEKMPNQFDELIQEYRPKMFVLGEPEVEKVRRIIQEFKTKAVASMQSANDFRNRFLHIMHALELLFGMSESAWTKREMHARLRGTIEFIQQQISHLERMDFSVHEDNYNFFSTRSRFGLNDSPMRELFDTNRSLKYELEAKEKELAELKGDSVEEKSEAHW